MDKAHMERAEWQLQRLQQGSGTAASGILLVLALRLRCDVM